MSTDRLLAQASLRVKDSLQAVVNAGEPDAIADFFSYSVLGLHLLAAALEYEEGERRTERLRRYTPKAVLREVDRMVATYQAGVRQIDGDDGSALAERGCERSDHAQGDCLEA
jgi:hypothetical protein